MGRNQKWEVVSDLVSEGRKSLAALLRVRVMTARRKRRREDLDLASGVMLILMFQNQKSKSKQKLPMLILEEVLMLILAVEQILTWMLKSRKEDLALGLVERRAGLARVMTVRRKRRKVVSDLASGVKLTLMFQMLT